MSQVVTRHRGVTGLMICWGVVAASEALSQERPLEGPGTIQEAANGVLRVLGITAVPDNTLSSLSIDATGGDTAVLSLIRFGGAFTASEAWPIYLEGYIGGARYDPEFVFTQGAEERVIPAKWNSVAGTVGIGWDFPLTDDLALRPIANASLGYIVSDVTVAGALLEVEKDPELDFLDEGQLAAYGLGGSLMLDYQHYRETYEIDAELRYTFLRLQSFGGTSSGVEGRADAQSADLWARYRWPTGTTLFERPLRYVLQGSHTTYLGDQAGALGFNHLTKLGGGLEVETTAFTGLLSRVRVVASGAFGENVTGFSLGFAASF